MLNTSQIKHLVGDGEHIWLQAEEFALAYHQQHSQRSKWATYLRIFTVLAAVCTAISTHEFFQGNIVIVQVAGLVTAVVAALNQAFLPEKKQQESWESWKNLLQLKSEVRSRCRGLPNAKDYDSEQLVFRSFENRLNTLTNRDVEITELQKQKASVNLQNAKLRPDLDEAPEELDVKDEGMAEEVDTSDVQLMTRGAH